MDNTTGKLSQWLLEDEARLAKVGGAGVRQANQARALESIPIGTELGRWADTGPIRARRSPRRLKIAAWYTRGAFAIVDWGTNPEGTSFVAMMDGCAAIYSRSSWR